MNDIMKYVNELIDLIKDSNIYKDYKKIENKVYKNKDIKKLVNKIKKLQKKAVNLEYKKNYKQLKNIEEELKRLYVELNNIPLYNEYEEKIDELNNMLLIVKNKFDLFTKEIIL